MELDLREGDMRDLELDEPAALIYCPSRSLLHLATWDDRRRTFERVAASLRPGGRFAWNAFAMDHRIAARLDVQHQDEPVPHTIRYAVGNNRIDNLLDHGGSSSLWGATKNEWLGLIDVAGLEIEALYRSFDRSPLDDESREYVSRAAAETASAVVAIILPTCVMGDIVSVQGVHETFARRGEREAGPGVASRPWTCGRFRRCTMRTATSVSGLFDPAVVDPVIDRRRLPARPSARATMAPESAAIEIEKRLIASV